MKIHILTLFPEMFVPVTEASILGRAGEKGILDISLIQIRDFSRDKHNKADDTPFGGGVGMVMLADPIFGALRSIGPEEEVKKKRILYMSPRGKMLDQQMIRSLAELDEMVILCGHYEGVDQRFIDAYVDEELSLGDFVLTGGELAAMAVTDAVCRMVPGVLAEQASFEDESHWAGTLEYPQYTRPEVWRDDSVPAVLLSGHHGNIQAWRRLRSLLRTRERRPDLFPKLRLTPREQKLLRLWDEGQAELSALPPDKLK